MTWKPTATLPVIEKRALLLSQLRAFFASRSVLEVDVPVIADHTVTDPYVEGLSFSGEHQSGFLQTSPEYYLKRFLAHYARDVYCLGKAFRDDPVSRRHRGEFTLLEWYRMRFDDRQLMDEVKALVAYVSPQYECRQVSYQSLFIEHFHVDPHQASHTDLKQLAAVHTSFEGDLSDQASWLDLLFSLVIEPTLQEPTLVYDYPAVQSALARKVHNNDDSWVARRFELFWQGRELANGYWELVDPSEQLKRFERDQSVRSEQGLRRREIDTKFLSAMGKGLPNCAGVALGVDRLLMCLLEIDTIDEVMPFANR